jgi:fatty acid synthase subunit alpha
MYYNITFGRITTVDREITVCCIALLNRADPDMLKYMQYNIDQHSPSKGEIRLTTNRQYSRGCWAASCL